MLNRDALGLKDGLLFEAMGVVRADLDRMGVNLCVQSDFWELRDLVKRLLKADPLCGAKVAPMYDVRYGDISPATAFWIAGIKDGEVVATIATRTYDWRETNALEEIESGRAFSVLADLGAEIRCAVPAIASQITGIVAHDGAMWVRPSLRGHREPGRKISHYLSRAVRFTGLQRCPSIDWWWSLQDRNLAEAGVARDAGYPDFERGTAIKWPGLPTRYGHFFMLSRDQTLADAERLASKGLLAT